MRGFSRTLTSRDKCVSVFARSQANGFTIRRYGIERQRASIVIAIGRSRSVRCPARAFICSYSSLRQLSTIYTRCYRSSLPSTGCKRLSIAFFFFYHLSFYSSACVKCAVLPYALFALSRLRLPQSLFIVLCSRTVTSFLHRETDLSWHSDKQLRRRRNTNAIDPFSRRGGRHRLQRCDSPKGPHLFRKCSAMP